MVVLFLYLVVPSNLNAAPMGILSWIGLSDTSGNTLEEAAAIAVAPNRRVYATGYSNPSSTQFDPVKFEVLTFGFSENGNRLWRQLYQGTGGDYDGGVGISIGPDGKVFIAAESTGTRGSPSLPGSGRDFVTIGYSQGGSMLWTQRFDGGVGDYNSPRAITTDQKGQVYVAGSSASGRTETSPYLGVIISYSSDGQSLWTNRFRAPGSWDSYPMALKTDSKGRLFSTFYLGQRLTGDVDTMVLCYSNSGALLWNRRFGIVGNYEPPAGLAVGLSGNIYIAKTGHTADDGEVYALSSEGALRWSRKYRGDVRALVVDRRENVIVGGIGEDEGGSLRTWQVVSFSAEGEAQWTNVIANRFYSYITAMETDSANNIMVTGVDLLSNQEQLPRIQTVAYSAEGTILWTHGLETESKSVGLAVDAAGNTYVGGSLKTNGTSKACVLRFAPILFIAPPTFPSAIPVGGDAEMGAEVTGVKPIHYQWYFNDKALIGATSTNLIVRGAKTENEGSYYLVASNAFQVLTSDVAQLKVITPPVVTLGQSTVIVGCGRSTNLTVTAVGFPPLTYQWRFRGTNLPNATNATLNLAEVDQDSAGLYDVTVTAFRQSVTSEPAVLIVDPQVPPIIHQFSHDTVTNLNSQIQFQVNAKLCGDATYQWYFNDATIAGATNSSLWIPSVSLPDAGSYRVHICNTIGCATSSMVRLTVNRPPVATNVGAITLRNQPLVLPTTYLLSKSFDPDGDTLSISSVSSESFWGSPVILSGTNVGYSPLAGFVGSDEFSYVVSDGRGGRRSALLKIFVLDGSPLLPNQLSIAMIPAGLRLRYLGLPGEHCRLQRSNTFSPLGWHDVIEFFVPTHGVWEFLHEPAGDTFYLRVLSL